MGSWETGVQGQSDMWYHPMEEDVYFIIGLSRRGVYFPHFPALPLGVAGETQLAYVQRYVSPDITSASEFQVKGGQLQIGAFEREDVRCLCYMLSSLSQYSSDGKCISFPMLYYVDSLLWEP
jgi:hypothetical protein